jgi:hypothetical protein
VTETRVIRLLAGSQRVTSRLREALEWLGDIFWIRPALIVLGGTLMGQAMVLAEQNEVRLPWLPDGWL